MVNEERLADQFSQGKQWGYIYIYNDIKKRRADAKEGTLSRERTNEKLVFLSLFLLLFRKVYEREWREKVQKQMIK